MNKIRRLTLSIDFKDGLRVIVDHTTRGYMSYGPFFHPFDPKVDLEDWYENFWKKHQVMEWYE